MNFTRSYHVIRRFLLKIVVPEFFWPVSVEIDGALIGIRNRPYSFGVKWILRKRNYENAERGILKDILFEGANVIEMGGSIGVLTSIISKGIGVKGRIVSIEASESITKYSKKWLEKLGNIKVETGFGFPVFETPRSLVVRTFDESAGSLGGIVKFDHTAPPTREPEEDIFDLKTIIKKHNLQPDILVIDIEGSESIMKTVKPDFPLSIKNILIELHPGLYENGQVDKDAIIETIRREGFVLEKCDFESCLFKRQ